ncbi:MAG: MBL fold metallo-hydrolase [Vicinamibacterales bacterium]
MRSLLVRGHNPGPWTGLGTNTYLVGDEAPALIDTATGNDAFVAELRAALETTAAGGELGRVLVTHAHVDHVGGVPALRSCWPDVRVSKRAWPEVDEAYGASWDAIEGEPVLDVAGTRLWALHTPGHAPDHLVFFEPRTGTLFGGDLVQNGNTIVVPASKGGHLGSYLSSLRKVLELAPRRILPGHGPPIDQPAALLRAYLAHRLQREQQIVDALLRGPASVDTLTATLYPSLDPALVGGARENVLAHLGKLGEEGSAHAIDGVWTLI